MLQEDSFTPTITAPNVVEGMVLQFAGEMVEATNGMTLPVWSAEITYVEGPDGLGERAFYVKPEGEDLEVFIWADPDRHYPIVG